MAPPTSAPSPTGSSSVVETGEDAAESPRTARFQASGFPLQLQAREPPSPHLEDMIGAGAERERTVGHPHAIDPHGTLVDLAIRLRSACDESSGFEDVRELEPRGLDEHRRRGEVGGNGPLAHASNEIA